MNQNPTWVYFAAFLMSFNGGYINSVSLLSILKKSVGYVTGNLTSLGDALAKGHLILFLHLIILVFCFLIGSILSGIIIKDQNLKLDGRYTLALIIQIIFVLIAMLLLLIKHNQASYLLALTMGLQNAMTTHYGSALIRTTHMTGTTTDLGILISMWLKKQKVEFWKMYLYITLILGFTCGAACGALIYSIIHAIALLLSVIIYSLMLKAPRNKFFRF